MKRDGGRCTYVSADGHRCECRRVEFDHIVPVAKGGPSTLDNLRLLCPAHNQNAADQALGAGLMERKRAAARRRAPLPAAATEVSQKWKPYQPDAAAIAAAREAQAKLAELWGSRTLG